MADFDTYPWQTFFNYLPVRTQQSYGPPKPPGYHAPVRPTYDQFQYTGGGQGIGQMLRGAGQAATQGIRGFGNYLANTPLPPSIGSPLPYNAAQGQQTNMGNMIRQAMGAGARAVGPALQGAWNYLQTTPLPPSIGSPMPYNAAQSQQTAANLPIVRPQVTQAAPAATPLSAAMNSTPGVMAQPQAGTHIAPGQNPALDTEINSLLAGIDARGEAMRAAFNQSPAGHLAEGRISALQQQRAALAPRATTEADWNEMATLAGRGNPVLGRSVLARMEFDRNRRDNRPAVGTQFLQTPIPETRQQRWERELADLRERATAAKARIENMSPGDRARLALQNTPPWWLPGGEAYDSAFKRRRARAEKALANQRDAFQARRAGMTITDYRRAQDFADMRNQLMSQLTQQTGGAAGVMDPLAVGMALGPQAAQIAQDTATLRAQTSAADADRRSRETIATSELNARQQIATADRAVQQAMVDVQRARTDSQRDMALAQLDQTREAQRQAHEDALAGRAQATAISRAEIDAQLQRQAMESQSQRELMQMSLQSQRDPNSPWVPGQPGATPSAQPSFMGPPAFQEGVNYLTDAGSREGYAREILASGYDPEAILTIGKKYGLPDSVISRQLKAISGPWARIANPTGSLRGIIDRPGWSIASRLGWVD